MTIINSDGGFIPEYPPVTTVLQDTSEKLIEISAKIHEIGSIIALEHESISQAKKWSSDNYDLKQSFDFQMVIRNKIGEGISLRSELDALFFNSQTIDRELSVMLKTRHFSINCPERQLVERIKTFIKDSTELKKHSDFLLLKLKKINQTI